ncbi:MAG: hypothetical protein D6834_02310 [Aquificota bacterium]|nr:MAG: hypothetical protein D6834_02310 [Aquificota bacterium]
MSRLKRRWITLNYNISSDVLRAYDITYKIGNVLKNQEFGDSDPSQYGGPGKNFYYERNGSEVISIRTIEDELDLKPYAPKDVNKDEILTWKFDSNTWPTSGNNIVDKSKIKVIKKSGLFPEKYMYDLDGNIINNRFTVLSTNWNINLTNRTETRIPTQSEILTWAKDVLGFTRGPSPYREDDPNSPHGDRTYQNEIATWDLGISDPSATDFNNDQYKKNSNPTKESGRYIKGSRIFVNQEGDLKNRADVVPSEKVLKDSQLWVKLENLSAPCRTQTKEFFFPGKFGGRLQSDPSDSGVGKDLLEEVYGSRFYWGLGIRAVIRNLYYHLGNGSITLTFSVNSTPFASNISLVSGNSPYYKEISFASNPLLIDITSSRIIIENRSDMRSVHPEDLAIVFKIEILGNVLSP